jgi:DNA-binding transcriptional MerR regulator
VSERGGGLTIEELAARVGVPVRTVRFYTTEGLRPGPGARGRGASYERDHLLRLRLIRRLSARRVPIAEIRETLTRLSTPDVAALLEEEERKAEELQRTPPATSPRAYVAALLKHSRTDAGGPGVSRFAAPSAPPPPGPAPPRRPTPGAPAPDAPDGPETGSELSWRRMELAPGVELHVRGDAALRQRDLIDRIRGAVGAPRASETSGGGQDTDRLDTDRRVDSVAEDEAGSGSSGGKG